MDGKTAFNLLNDGKYLRIKCWPEDFYLFKNENVYQFSDGKILLDFSFFDVNDWEEYDPSLLFFSARCEVERLNNLKKYYLEEDIIDL